jgi:hypothetical protein
VNGAPELICWSIGFEDGTEEMTLLLSLPDGKDEPTDSEVIALGDMLAGELESIEVRLQR